MDDDPEFRKVFASLADNWAIKSDNEFALKIMKQSLGYFSILMKFIFYKKSLLPKVRFLKCLKS